MTQAFRRMFLDLLMMLVAFQLFGRAEKLLQAVDEMQKSLYEDVGAL